MNTGSKFTYNFTRLLAPTAIHMTQHSRNFSYILPKTGLDVSTMKFNQHPNRFFMDENGNFVSALNRYHMHFIVKDKDGKNVSAGLWTTHPQSKTKVINALDLGKGTIENGQSSKNQYLGLKEKLMRVPEGLSEVPGSDSFWQETQRLNKIDVDAFAENISKKNVETILCVECNDPRINGINLYGNDKHNKEFRELLKKQVLEQHATGKMEDHHIVKIIK